MRRGSGRGTTAQPSPRRALLRSSTAAPEARAGGTHHRGRGPSHGQRAGNAGALPSAVSHGGLACCSRRRWEIRQPADWAAGAASLCISRGAPAARFARAALALSDLSPRGRARLRFGPRRRRDFRREHQRGALGDVVCAERCSLSVLGAASEKAVCETSRLGSGGRILTPDDWSRMSGGGNAAPRKIRSRRPGIRRTAARSSAAKRQDNKTTTQIQPRSRSDKEREVGGLALLGLSGLLHRREREKGEMRAEPRMRPPAAGSWLQAPAVGGGGGRQGFCRQENRGPPCNPEPPCPL